MRIVEVTGGVDTHADNHMAAAVDHNGGLLGVESFPATETGFEGLLAWLVGFGPVKQVGVEGTGSWGVGLRAISGLRERFEPLRRALNYSACVGERSKPQVGPSPTGTQTHYSLSPPRSAERSSP